MDTLIIKYIRIWVEIEISFVFACKMTKYKSVIFVKRLWQGLLPLPFIYKVNSVKLIESFTIVWYD